MSSLNESKELAALRLAMGEHIGDVALTVGKSRRTLDRWLEDDSFKERVGRHRERIATAAERGMTKILLSFDHIVDEQIQIALDRTHKDQAQVGRHLLDKVIIPRNRQETVAHHTVDISFWENLDERLTKLDQLRTITDITSPKLLSGKAAHEAYAVRPDGKNGSGTEDG